MANAAQCPPHNQHSPSTNTIVSIQRSGHWIHWKHAQIQLENGVFMLILLIILILVFGFGGYRMGPGIGYYGGGGISLILLIVLILLLLHVV